MNRTQDLSAASQLSSPLDHPGHIQLNPFGLASEACSVNLQILLERKSFLFFAQIHFFSPSKRFASFGPAEKFLENPFVMP